MTDNNNLQQFPRPDEQLQRRCCASGNDQSSTARRRSRRSARSSRSPARDRACMMHADRLAHLMNHPDPSIAMSGQVGSQIKMKVGTSWLIANVRTLCAGEDGAVIANVDFLGEGGQHANGGLLSFRRGVTRYPIPGCEIMPVTTEDMRAIFAADDSAAHRDRHRLSDRRHPRHALRRPDAVEAFRDPRLDRHRQVDLGRADPPPHLAALARGPHRDDRSARRIFGGVQELRRIVQRRQSPAALLADQLRGALRGAADHRRRRARARRRHPRQMPARGAHQGQECRDASARSPSIRRSPICCPTSTRSWSTKWASSTAPATRCRSSGSRPSSTS